MNRHASEPRSAYGDGRKNRLESGPDCSKSWDQEVISSARGRPGHRRNGGDKWALRPEQYARNQLVECLPVTPTLGATVRAGAESRADDDESCNRPPRTSFLPRPTTWTLSPSRCRSMQSRKRRRSMGTTVRTRSRVSVGDRRAANSPGKTPCRVVFQLSSLKTDSTDPNHSVNRNRQRETRTSQRTCTRPACGRLRLQTAARSRPSECPSRRACSKRRECAEW